MLLQTTQTRGTEVTEVLFTQLREFWVESKEN